MEKQPIHLTPQEIDDLLGQLNDSSKKKDNIDNIKRYAFIMTFAPKLADIVISKIRPDLAKAQEQNKTKSLTR